jgi:hypothetical protein
MSREHPTVFQSQDNSFGLPGNWALGLWLTYRKMATAAYVPSKRARLALYGRQPFWYTFGYPNGTFQAMTPFSNQDDRVTVINDFLLLAIQGSAVDQVTGTTNFDFTVQLIDTGMNEPWTQFIAPMALVGGTAAHPFILRRPHKVLAGTPMLARFANVHAANNNLPQVSLFGVLAAPSPSS